MLDDDLRAAAERVLAAAPCSLEMPAGTGKTHLLAAAAAAVVESGHRVLLLTHTNAGVEVLRRRLRQFDVPTSGYHIDTITGWAFSLVRAYPVLANMTVPENPNWQDSQSYINGATRVAGSSAVRTVHAASFGTLLVDEYQDCNEAHHRFVRSIKDSVPSVVVFGDRLQGIYGFSDPIVDWDTHVTPEFPPFDLAHTPHRWANHNPELGEWLLGLRGSLVDGGTFDTHSHRVPGLSRIVHTDSSLYEVAYSFDDPDETVLIIDKWSSDAAIHASKLGGGYVVIEDVAGRFMRQQLLTLPAEGAAGMCLWLARFAKACSVGMAKIDATVLNRLERNESVLGLLRPGLEPVLAALESLRLHPTYATLLSSAHAIQRVEKVRVYRREAWYDTLEAIDRCKEDGLPVLSHFARVRDRLRQIGRRKHSRISSTTLLVKGLEYDHVVVANLSKLVDPRHLYVALTRARKSVVIISATPSIQLQLDG